MKLTDCGAPQGGCFVLELGGIHVMVGCPMALHRSLEHFFPSSGYGCPSPSTSFEPTTNTPQATAKTKRIAVEEPTGNKRVKTTDSSPMGWSLKHGHWLADGKPWCTVPSFDSVNMEVVDAVLISSAFDALALPFLTEYTKFNGVVLMTRATLALTHLVMEEMVLFFQEGEGKDRRQWSHLSSLVQLPVEDYKMIQEEMRYWKTMYSRKDAKAALEKVKDLSYHQDAVIQRKLHIEAIPSGHSIGACNWVLEADFEKVVVCNASCVSGAHRPPAALEIDPLKHADAMIVRDVAVHSSVHEVMDALVVTIRKTLGKGGSVLIPVDCSDGGLLLDMLEEFAKRMGDALPPLFVVSSSARRTIAYTEIAGEWLHISRRKQMYAAAPTLACAELQTSGRLTVLSGIDDPGFIALTNTPVVPSIVFAGHPSLRFGPAARLTVAWKSNPLHALCWIDPKYNPLAVMAPYEVLEMTVANHIVDTGWTFAEANKIIQTTLPKVVVVPEEYVNEENHSIQASHCPLLAFVRRGCIDVPIHASGVKGSVSRELVSTLVTQQVGNAQMARVNARLTRVDGQWMLEPPKDITEAAALARSHPFLMWGKPLVADVLLAIKERGWGHRVEKQLAEEEGQPPSFVIGLPQMHATLTLNPGETVIETKEEKDRILLREMIVGVMNYKR